MDAWHVVRNKKAKVWVFGMMTLWLIACGGGGGGDGGGGFVDTNQPLALTDTGAREVSGLTMGAAMGGATVGSLGNVVIASADHSPGATAAFNLLDLPKHVFHAIPALQTPVAFGAGAIHPAEVAPVIDCPGGGTIETSWTDSDADGALSVTDGGVLLFNNCGDKGLILNGDLDVGVLTLTGDPLTGPPWSVELRLNFNNLRASDNGGVIGVFGTLDVTVDTQVSGTVLTNITTEVGPGPAIDASSAITFGEGDDFTKLSRYSLTLTESADGSFSVSSQGILESSLIGGTVTFESLQVLAGIDFFVDNPSAGQLRITGGANSTILMRITNNISVALDIDDDGDGFDAGDTTISTTWEELEAAANAL